MVWGIIGALDAEIALLREKMDLEKTVETYGCTFYVGTLCGQRVVLVCCSIGTINATACASVVIREFGATAVVNVGIAGCASPELGILDVAVADDLVFHDADLGILEKYYPFRSSFPTDEKLQKLAVDAMEALPDRKFQYKVGRIASGDAFVDSSARKQNIVKRFAPLCMEMEGAAIAQVAYMNSIPCLVIRSMSDNADDGAEQTYDNFLEVAAQQSAAILLGMLSLYQE